MKNYVLVFGGQSVEHDISILTALNFNNSYVGDNRLASLYISKTGEWFFCAKRLNKDMFRGELSSEFIPVKFITNDKCLYTKTLLGYKKVFEIDIAINCCHGGAGEKGELNFAFTSRNIPVSAGSVLGLSCAMDKAMAKKVFIASGIPTVPWLEYGKAALMSAIIKDVESFGYPVVVKPNALGSSIGVQKVDNPNELVKAVNVAFEFDDKIIIERAVTNVREFNCAIIKGKDCVLSEIDEPVKGKVFSFADKYLKKGTGGKSKTKQKFSPVILSQKLSGNIRELTKRCVEELGLFGVIRVDFLYDAKRGKLYVNEVNAVPGTLAYFLFKNMTQTKMIEALAKIAEEQMQFKIKSEYITEVLK